MGSVAERNVVDGVRPSLIPYAGDQLVSCIRCPRQHLDTKEYRPNVRESFQHRAQLGVVSVERVIAADLPVRRDNADSVDGTTSPFPTKQLRTLDW